MKTFSHQFSPSLEELNRSIESLQNNEAKISKTELVKKNKKLSHWNFTVALCILRYLQELRRGEEKMVASQKIANFVSSLCE